MRSKDRIRAQFRREDEERIATIILLRRVMKIWKE
jgi:hypothetical protein